jgi:von Willebrand factor type A domain-containing protein
MTFRSGAWGMAGVGLLLVASIGACSATKNKGSLPGDDELQSGGDDGESASSDDGGGGGSSGSSSGGAFSGSSSGSPGGGPTSADAACASSSQHGEQQGLDAYMMLDYSGSMVGAKWMGVTSALNSFVGQAGSGISVGLQYFGLPDADGGGSIFGIPIGDSCDPSTYAQPAIEIAPLPGVGSMITSSLAAHTLPNTSTPTPPALQGAINHATAWAKAHASDVTIVILATDGEPSECGDNSSNTLLQQVEAIAAAGVAQTPKILTFVIGVGSDLTSLNGIAQAGGTGTAFIVDTSMNVSQQFLTALNKIRGAALGCQYKIPVPAGGATVDFEKVNVQFTPANGASIVVPYVTDKSKCPSSGNAWYYDNASNPTEILLCTTTCGTVSAGGQLDVLTGCQRVDVPTK